MNENIKSAQREDLKAFDGTQRINGDDWTFRKKGFWRYEAIHNDIELFHYQTMESKDISPHID